MKIHRLKKMSQGDLYLSLLVGVSYKSICRLKVLEEDAFEVDQYFYLFISYPIVVLSRIHRGLYTWTSK